MDLRFNYQKTSAEIIAKVTPKIEVLGAKVKERESRIAKLRED